MCDWSIRTGVQKCQPFPTHSIPLVSSCFIVTKKGHKARQKEWIFKNNNRNHKTMQYVHAHEHWIPFNRSVSQVVTLIFFGE